MSFILRDIAQHSHVVVLYGESYRFAAAIIPQSLGQPVNNIHILWFKTKSERSSLRFRGRLHSVRIGFTAAWAWRMVVEPIFALLKLEVRCLADLNFLQNDIINELF
jgi:hypothetical protein